MYICNYDMTLTENSKRCLECRYLNGYAEIHLNRDETVGFAQSLKIAQFTERTLICCCQRYPRLCQYTTRHCVVRCNHGYNLSYIYDCYTLGYIMTIKH